MANSVNWKNCRVIIRDIRNDALLADTLLKSWDKERNTIRIESGEMIHKNMKNVEGDTRVSVLMMFSGELIEFNGILRDRVVANTREIALSRRRERENRKATRYNIDVDGIVEGMVFYKQRIGLRKPIWVRTENISKTGLLIRTLSRSFEVGDVFTLLLELQGQKIRNTYEIVRKQNSGIWQEEYGCKRLVI